MDVLSYDLPMEVSPGILGGNEWRRRHVHTILKPYPRNWNITNQRIGEKNWWAFS